MALQDSEFVEFDDHFEFSLTGYDSSFQRFQNLVAGVEENDPKTIVLDVSSLSDFEPGYVIGLVRAALDLGAKGSSLRIKTSRKMRERILHTIGQLLFSFEIVDPQATPSGRFPAIADDADPSFEIEGNTLYLVAFDEGSFVTNYRSRLQKLLAVAAETRFVDFTAVDEMSPVAIDLVARDYEARESPKNLVFKVSAFLSMSIKEMGYGQVLPLQLGSPRKKEAKKEERKLSFTEFAQMGHGKLSLDRLLSNKDELSEKVRDKRDDSWRGPAWPGDPAETSDAAAPGRAAAPAQEVQLEIFAPGRFGGPSHDESSVADAPAVGDALPAAAEPGRSDEFAAAEEESPFGATRRTPDSPEPTASADRRDALRFRARSAVVLYGREAEKRSRAGLMVKSPVVNLSTTGTQFLSKRDLAKGERVRLLLNVPGFLEPLEVSALVSWTKRVKKGETVLFRVGVEFEDPSTKVTEGIRKLQPES